MFVVDVNKGQEVVQTITAESAVRGVASAGLLLIGAVERCAVSIMPADDPLNDIVTEYEQPFELTGTGEIVDGRAHVHVALGGEGMTVVGHLHHATVGQWFVRAYVTPVG